MDERTIGGGGAGADGRDPTMSVALAYDAWAPELRAHVSRLVRDASDADDVVQEAFLRLQAESEAGRAPRQTRPWLHRVVANLAMSRGRHAGVVHRTIPRLWESDHAAGPEDVVLRHEHQDGIRAALATLPRQDREVLLMAAAGLSGPEIAARIGRTELATRTLLCRARGRLRERLAETATVRGEDGSSDGPGRPITAPDVTGARRIPRASNVATPVV
jgi:RNA polymerase sigma factor (sigma-70 family)